MSASAPLLSSPICIGLDIGFSAAPTPVSGVINSSAVAMFLLIILCFKSATWASSTSFIPFFKAVSNALSEFFPKAPPIAPPNNIPPPAAYNISYGSLIGFWETKYDSIAALDTPPVANPLKALANLVALEPHIKGAATPSVNTVAVIAAGSIVAAANRNGIALHPYPANVFSFSNDCKTLSRNFSAWGLLTASSKKSWYSNGISLVNSSYDSSFNKKFSSGSWSSNPLYIQDIALSSANAAEVASLNVIFSLSFS